MRQDWFIENGDISISAGTSGNNVTQNGTTTENDTNTVIKSKDPSTASSNTVTIEAGEGKTVDVTLDNVTINVDEGTKYAYDPNAYKTAVSVTGSGNTNIELNGNNTLTSGYGHAGLEHNKTDSSGTLTITDDKGDAGSLTATGGFGGAGIGGAGNRSNGTYYTGDGDVTITGGSITATGGKMAAGIGGGAYGDGNVTITGGDITAKGNDKGAGIGGGMGSQTNGRVSSSSKGSLSVSRNTIVGGDGNVTISGGTITEASGGEMAAGIGGGYQGTGNVTINGDTVVKNAQGGVCGAGIGGGSGSGVTGTGLGQCDH